MYHRHSGYTGGLTSVTAGKMLEKTPEELIKKAVKALVISDCISNVDLILCNGKPYIINVILKENII